MIYQTNQNIQKEIILYYATKIKQKAYTIFQVDFQYFQVKIINW